MPRNSGLLLSLVFLTLLGGISCGGSSSPGGGTIGPFNVVGNWQATFTANGGGSTTQPGAISSSGLAAFFDSSGNIARMPTINGANTFSGNLTAYAVNPTFFPNGTIVVTDSAQGKVSSATSIAGTFTGNGTTSGSFTMAPYAPLGGPVVPVSGTLNGRIIGFVDTLQVTFLPDGSFTGTDFAGGGSNCNISGNVTQDGTNNVFNVTYNNASGACSPSTMTGLAFESKSDYFNVNGGVDASYLYVIMLTSTQASVRPSVYVIFQ
jgi:hypothetical protein